MPSDKPAPAAAEPPRIRHHFRKRRGYKVCWMCGQPVTALVHWEATP